MQQKINNNIKLPLALSIILLFLVLINIANQRNFEDIEKAATSIYEDRLLPSMYIFEIREYLYKGRITQKENVPLAEEYRTAVMQVVDRYEHTVLTKQESVDLSSLKANLHQLFRYPVHSEDFELFLENTLSDLNALLQIQSGEGHHLKKDMISNLQHSTVLSYIDICLLITVAALIVSLLSSSRKIFFRQIPKNSSLN